ncbi:MAG: TetR/AcrR family transcriptional regulator [Sneathiella sp.]|nr:TetR/AcrR family transcriptional regulator [Sneathiella sp.]
MSSNPLFSEPSKAALSKSEQTRSLILAAAARLFREQGYTASTLRKIATKAGIEAGSIYYHFNSKDEILDEVLDLGLRQIFEAVKKTRGDCEARGEGFREIFAAMVQTHLTYLLQASDFTSSNIRNFSMLPGEMRERHRPLRRAYADEWDDAFAKALAEGSIRSDIRVVPLRQFVIGALNWTVEWFDASRYSIAVFSRKAAELILDGMLTEPGKPVAEKIISEAVHVELPVTEGSKAAHTRSYILSSAAKVMRNRGFSASTVRHIADAAGMEAGSIYYHFSSKDEILDEVLDRGLRDLFEGVSRVLEDDKQFPNHRSRIAAAIRAHMMFLFARSEFSSANIRIYGQLPEKVRARHRPIRYEYSKAWDKSLSEAREAGEIRPDIEIAPLRQVMLGALNWTVEWFDPQKGGEEDFYTLEEMIAMLQTLLLDGIVRHATMNSSGT